MASAHTSGLNRKQRKDFARRLRSEDPGLEVMHPHAAGIDVGNSAVDLPGIDGIDVGVAQTLISEVGFDMTRW